MWVCIFRCCLGRKSVVWENGLNKNHIMLKFEQRVKFYYDFEDCSKDGIFFCRKEIYKAGGKGHILLRI